MYRKPSPKQRQAQDRKMEAMRRGKDRARMERPAPGRAPDLPDLRRVVTVTDYDGAEPVTHTITMHKTRRIDTYRCEADGQAWKCCGWAKVLEGLRKAYPRVPSLRSDFWE